MRDRIDRIASYFYWAFTRSDRRTDRSDRRSQRVHAPLPFLQRDAVHSAVVTVVRRSVRLYVTLVYCIKTANERYHVFFYNRFVLICGNAHQRLNSKILPRCMLQANHLVATAKGNLTSFEWTNQTLRSADDSSARLAKCAVANRLVKKSRLFQF